MGIGPRLTPTPGRGPIRWRLEETTTPVVDQAQKGTSRRYWRHVTQRYVYGYSVLILRRIVRRDHTKRSDQGEQHGPERCADDVESGDHAAGQTC